MNTRADSIKLFLICLLIVVGAVPSIGVAGTNKNIIYQGRILRPDGTVINSGALTFTLSVFSPQPSHCLLYSETQLINMSGSQGMFSLRLGAGTRSDSGSHTFNQIFVNGLSLSSLSCASGTSYTSGADDDRDLVVSFNDSGTIVNLASMAIKSVPFALQAHEIDGWGLNNLVKVSSIGSPTTFTTSEMANVKTVGAASCTSGEILKWNGSAWMCSTDATGGSPGDAGYTGSKGLVAFDTDAATSGIAVASGIAKLSNTGVTAAAYGSTSKVSSVTVNAQGRITAASEIAISIPSSQITQSGANVGEVLKWNGSAWLPSADNTGTSPGDASYAGKGLVQGLTDAATSGLNISSGVISVNSGVGANQIVKLDASSKLPAVDGSALTNLRMTQIASGTLPISQGGTGQSTKTAAFDALSPNTTKGDLAVHNGTNNIRLPVGSDGQVLTADSSQPSGVKWAPVTAGTVTSITGGTGILGGTITSAGTLSINVGTGANQIVQLDGSARLPGVDGSQLKNLSAIQISSGTLPVNRGGSGASSFSSNQLVGSNGTGTALQSVTCSQNQVLSFDASGNYGCYNASTIMNGTFFANGGNSFGATATLGTNDAYALNIATNSTTRMTVLSTGEVGIGTSSPSAPLHVKNDTTSGTYSIFEAGSNWNGNVKLASFRSAGAEYGYISANQIYMNDGNVGSGAAQIVTSRGFDMPPNIYGYAYNGGRIGVFGTNTGTSNTGAAGVVGQGSMNPGMIAESTGATNDSIIVTSRSLTTGRLAYFEHSNTTFSGDALQMNLGQGTGSFTGNFLNFKVNGTQKMIVTASGSLGIGVTSPSTKLHINGTLQIADGGETCSIAGHGGMIRYNGGNLQFCNGSAWQTLGVSGAGLTSLNGLTGSTQTISTGTAGTDFAVSSSGSTHTFNLPDASATARGALSSADWTTFNSKLGTSTTFSGDVSGAYNATSVDKIKGGTLSFSSLASGNFLKYNGSAWVNTNLVAADIPNLDAAKITTGILPVSVGGTGSSSFSGNRLVGTNGTGTALQSVTCSQNQVISFDASGNYGCYNLSAIAGGTYFSNGGNSYGATAVLGTTDNQALKFMTNNSHRMILDSSGNLGIGTLSPTNPLSVAGNANVTGNMTVDGVLEVNSYSINFNGTPFIQTDFMVQNVSIGPLSGGASGMYNTTAGYMSGLSITGTTNYTSVFGASAGYYATGSYNTFMGANAAGQVTTTGTGQYNTAIGASSLYRLSNGGDNVAVGRSAGYNISTGAGNTTIGPKAGYSITTGNNNVVIGGNNGSSIATLSNYMIFSEGAGTERMRIDNAGNVGIGTTSPAVKLDIAGTASMSSSVEGISSYVNTGAAYTIPGTTVNVVRLTLDNNTTVTLPSFTSPSGKVFTLTVFLKQDATGSRTVAFAGAASDVIKWDSGTAPTISSTASKVTILQFTKPSDEAIWYASMVWKEN